MEITVQEILEKLSQAFQPHSETAALDAQVLVAHHLGKPRSWVLAHPEATLTGSEYKVILHSSQRIEQGAPLPYVIGHWEFYGLDFIVTPGVLIPRPETELLVERAIRWLKHHPHKRRVVDVGTGSGCIGVSIAHHVSAAQVVLADISAKALKVARSNAEKHGLLGSVETQRSNLLAALGGHFDLVCANLPYIPTQALESLPVAKSEPRLALDGGQDGMKLFARFLEQTKRQLDPGGLLLFEIDPGQSSHVLHLVHKFFPAEKVRILQDLAGRDRCVELELRYAILHLCERRDWLGSQGQGEYRPASLETEGFIHCSQEYQVIEVANRYYAGVPDMVVLWIDPQKLASEIRWEMSGETYYPHVYGPINLEAVDRITDLRLENDGKYRFV